MMANTASHILKSIVILFSLSGKTRCIGTEPPTFRLFGVKAGGQLQGSAPVGGLKRMQSGDIYLQKPRPSCPFVHSHQAVCRL